MGTINMNELLFIYKVLNNNISAFQLLDVPEGVERNKECMEIISEMIKS
jgi:hypothetical protein